jgi:heavy metal sensor kinase
VGCGIAVYLILSYSLMQEIDKALDRQYDAIADRLEEGHDLDELLEHGHHSSAVMRLTGTDGKVPFESEVLRSFPVPLPPDSPRSSPHVLHDVSHPEHGPFRFMSGTVQGKTESWLVQVGMSLADYHHELAELRMVLLMILPVGLLAAVGGGYWLAGRSLAPVQRITSTAQTISAPSLSQRVAVPNPNDELGQLAETINGMIGRLERAFDSMRQLTADASHELVTPLTAVRTEVEVALRAERPPEQYRRVLASVLEEVERMSKLADSLLLLSREDARVVQTPKQVIRLDALVQEVAGHMGAVAGESGIRMTVQELPAMTVQGDPDGLRQVFFNLLDNAVKYTSQGGNVMVRGLVEDNQIVIEVADTGIGIPCESLSRVFDRFYRVDKSRSRELGGTGLGLSISKALVERHGGRIEVESALGKGSTFRVVLSRGQTG